MTGTGSTGVCGVSTAYMDPACPVDSQKVYLSASTMAYTCIQCASGQTSDGSTSPCTYPSEVVPKYSTVIICVASALCIALTLAVMAAVCALRKRAVLRAASPLFLGLILVGVLLALTTVILASQNPATSALCESATVFGHVAYALSIGALVAKSYRLAAIFNQRRVKVLKISDRQLALVLAALLLVLLIYLTVWMTVDPPAATVVVSVSTASQTLLCRSSSTVWSVLLVSVEAALLLYGMAIAYRCRHNPEAFNETRHIAVILYNSAFIGAATVGVLYAVTLSAFTTTVLLCASILVVAATMVTVLIGPKFYQIYANHTEQSTELQPHSQHSSHTSNGQLVVRSAAKSQLGRPIDDKLKPSSPYGSPSSHELGFRSIAAHTPLSADRSWMETPVTVAGRNSSSSESELRAEENVGRPQQQQHVKSPTSSSSVGQRTVQAQRIASLVAVTDSP